MQLVLGCKNVFFQVHADSKYKTKKSDKLTKAEAEMRYVFDQLR